MFYSRTFLARKSPLGTVWIAAHLERKIKKPQIDGIDIPSYAECIMFPEVPIALRLSGHLLLGLVRIYSWKVNYLFQDCNRMLTTIRTAFASVQIDLPVDADRAPVEAITLPDRFELDALEMDDIDTPDNHRKTYDQITLSEDFHGGDQYVTFVLDEDNRVDLSPPQEASNVGSAPREEETFPPFDGNFEATIASQNNEGLAEPAPDNLGEDSGNINQNNLATDPPEVMHEAPPMNNNLAQDPTEMICEAPPMNSYLAEDSPEMMREAPPMNFEPRFTELDDASGGHMDMDHQGSYSKIKSKDGASPVMIRLSSTGRDSLPAVSPPNALAASAADPIAPDTSMSFGHPLPELALQPSPVQQKNRKRARFDKVIVLSNDYMNKRIQDRELHDVVCKRRKLPTTALDVWKFNLYRQKDRLFMEPSLNGMCTTLHDTSERNFPILSVDSAFAEASKGVAGPSSIGVQEAGPDPVLPQNSAGNADALLDRGMLDDDMVPELPRYHPTVEVNLRESEASPSGREEISPFKTAKRTPGSNKGTTFEPELLATNESNLSPGRRGLGLGPQTPLFQLDEEFDKDLPEIPGLLNSAEDRDLDFLVANSSSPATEVAELGSMSARTRAVAQYFKDQTPLTPTSDDEPGKFSLNKILEGKTRRHCARMFFETLVLKSYDYIEVQQEEAYGDISVSVKPSLSTAKF